MLPGRAGAFAVRQPDRPKIQHLPDIKLHQQAVVELELHDFLGERADAVGLQIMARLDTTDTDSQRTVGMSSRRSWKMASISCAASCPAAA